MPWVCTCGQRNIVAGLPCLACDRTESAIAETVADDTVTESTRARRRRFREDVVEEAPEVAAEAEAPRPRRNRFREEPVIEEPIVEETVVDEPVVAEPVVAEPVLEAPVGAAVPIDNLYTHAWSHQTEEEVVAPAAPETNWDANSWFTAEPEAVQQVEEEQEEVQAPVAHEEDRSFDAMFPSPWGVAASVAEMEERYAQPSAAPAYDWNDVAEQNEDTNQYEQDEYEDDYEEDEDDSYVAPVPPTERIDTAAASNFGERPWWLDQMSMDNDEEQGFGQHVAGDTSHFFADDVDVDFPEDFETEDDDWSTPSRSPRFNREQLREPDEDTSWAERDPDFEPAHKPGLNIPGLSSLPVDLNDPRIKLALVLIVVLVIGLVSIAGKTVITKVAGPANAELISSGSATCATAKAVSTSTKAAALETAMLSQPTGLKVRPDYEAGTGAVDFSKALQLESDSNNALATLDQTRFLRGYTRSFTGANNIEVATSVYEFAADTCATDYLKSHTTGDQFDVSSVPGAVGTMANIDGNTIYTVRAASGNRLFTIEWMGGKTTEAAQQGAAALAAAQLDSLAG